MTWLVDLPSHVVQHADGANPSDGLSKRAFWLRLCHSAFDDPFACLMITLTLDRSLLSDNVLLDEGMPPIRAKADER